MKNFILALTFLFTIQCLFAQNCTDIYVNTPSITCHTPTNDPADDYYTVTFFSYHLNGGSTWSSPDLGVSNIAYGNYDIPTHYSPETINTITIIDDLDPTCTKDISFGPAVCRVDCPSFDVTYTKVEESGCCATYLINLKVENINIPMSNLFFRLNVAGGSLKDFSFLSGQNELLLNGVSIGANYIFGGSNLTSSNINSTPLTATICGENAGDVVTIGHEKILLTVGNVTCSTLGTPTVASFATQTNTIGGTVIAPGDIYKCINTVNNGIQNATVTVSPGCEVTTAADGSYMCETCEDGPYTVCADMPCPEPCGVSTYDLLLMRDIILNIAEGKGKNKGIIYAGDVDRSGSINTRDLIKLQRHLLGLDSTITDWCRFVPVTDLIPPSPDPMADNCVTINNPSTLVDFLRYMIGDVDGSCTDCDGQDKEEKLKENLFVSTNGNKVSLRASKTQHLAGIGITLNINPGDKIRSVTSKLPGLMYSRIAKDKLYISWIDLDTKNNRGVNILENDELVSIDMITSDISAISFESGAKSTTDGTIADLIDSNKGLSMRSSSNEEKTLFFNSWTDLSIDSDVNKVNYFIYDIYGNLLYRSQENIEYNSSISVDKQLKSGVYILHVHDGVKEYTKKFVILN